MNKYVFEGKSEEEVILIALKELNVKEEEMIYNICEEKNGILKKKKYIINIILKSEILNYTKDLLNKITKAMNIKINVETKRKENYLKLTIFSDSSPILIGKNGRTLNALQNILRQSILNKTGISSNIILDVENYKEKREKNIAYLAKKVAKEVIKTNIEVKLDSMNSYERRIVHNILSDFKGVNTISEGEEPNRYVIIKPSK